MCFCGWYEARSVSSLRRAFLDGHVVRPCPITHPSSPTIDDKHPRDRTVLLSLACVVENKLLHGDRCDPRGGNKMTRVMADGHEIPSGLAVNLRWTYSAPRDCFPVSLTTVTNASGNVQLAGDVISRRRGEECGVNGVEVSMFLFKGRLRSGNRFFLISFFEFQASKNTCLKGSCEIRKIPEVNGVWVA